MAQVAVVPAYIRSCMASGIKFPGIIIKAFVVKAKICGARKLAYPVMPSSVASLLLFIPVLFPKEDKPSAFQLLPWWPAPQ